MYDSAKKNSKQNGGSISGKQKIKNLSKQIFLRRKLFIKMCIISRKLFMQAV